MEFLDRITGLFFMLCGAAILVDQFHLYRFTVLGLDTTFWAAFLIVAMEVFRILVSFITQSASVVRIILGIVVLAFGLLYFVKSIITLPDFLVNNLGIFYGILLILLNFGSAM